VVLPFLVTNRYGSHIELGSVKHQPRKFLDHVRADKLTGALHIAAPLALAALMYRLEVFDERFVATLSALVAVGLLAIPTTVVAIALYYLARSAGARARHMVGITYHGHKAAWWTQPFYLAVWVIGWALWIAFVLTLATIDAIKYASSPKRRMWAQVERVLSRSRLRTMPGHVRIGRTNEGIDCVVDMAVTGMTSGSFCTSEWREKIHTAAGRRCRGVRLRNLEQGGLAQITLVYHDPMASLRLGRAPVMDVEVADITKPVEIGIDERGKPVTVTLWKNNIILGGMLDKGKSTTMANMIGYGVLDPRFRHYGIDCKRVELSLWRPAFAEVVTDADEGHRLVQELRDLCDVLTNQLVADDVGQHQPTIEQPGYILWVDEMSLLHDGKHGKPDTQSLLFEVMQLGRACSVSVVGGMPRPSADKLNSSTRSLFGDRIAHQCRDNMESNIILGTGLDEQGWDASKLTRQGEFLIVSDKRNPLRCRAYELPREQRHELARRGAYDEVSVEQSESAQSAPVDQVGTIGGTTNRAGADWQPPPPPAGDDWSRRDIPFAPYLVPDRPPAEAQAKVQTVLEQHPDGLKFGELKDKARVSRDTVDKALKAGEGKWCRKELGRWIPMAARQDVA
jgi:S-DNA-T family DNA segregation ATPase FtsK/SpoIIIE